MTRKEIKRGLKSLIPQMDTVMGDDEHEPYRCVYLGSSLDLDPCGKYHHLLSPNGVTAKCERYWSNLETAAEELGGWLQTGDDPLEKFFCMPKQPN